MLKDPDPISVGLLLSMMVEILNIEFDETLLLKFFLVGEGISVVN